MRALSAAAGHLPATAASFEILTVTREMVNLGHDRPIAHPGG